MSEVDNNTKNLEEGPKTVYGEFNQELNADVFEKKEENSDTSDEETVTIFPDLPMSVAFIGAPGVGKADVIDKFIDLISPWLSDRNNSIVVLRNSGLEIEEKYDIAMGQFGGYRENLWTFFNRLEQERIAEINGHSYVTSGTIIESLAYCGVNYEIAMLGNENGIVTPDTQNELNKIQVAMTMLTYLFIDNFRYKFAFYIPRSESIIIPGQDETAEQRLSRRIDNALNTIFQNFSLRIQSLDQPTNEERAKVAFDTIVSIYESGVEVPKSLAPLRD